MKFSKNNGLISIQVKTGKYQPQDETTELIQPDTRIDSIANLPSVIKY